MPVAGVVATPTGIGLRQPHYREVLEAKPALGFVEVHSENFFADGGAALAVLGEARQRYPVSLHGVGLALGSAAGLDPWHLDHLARLAERIEPVRVSDHLCFARAPRQHGGPVLHASDLLPVAHNEASLAILCHHLDQVQSRLKRRLLVENLSAYLHAADDGRATYSEADFLAELARRSGCALLLDLNNLMVNALNDEVTDPLAHCQAAIDRLPARGVVAEIHLAGYRDLRPEGQGIVIDDHGSRVRPAVWDLLAHALRRFGPVPCLVEWDTDLPPLEVLLDEAAQADRIAATVLAPAARACP
jgi:uncharacterized protein